MPGHFRKRFETQWNTVCLSKYKNYLFSFKKNRNSIETYDLEKTESEREKNLALRQENNV